MDGQIDADSPGGFVVDHASLRTAAGPFLHLFISATDALVPTALDYDLGTAGHFHQHRGGSVGMVSTAFPGQRWGGDSPAEETESESTQGSQGGGESSM